MRASVYFSESTIGMKMLLGACCCWIAWGDDAVAPVVATAVAVAMIPESFLSKYGLQRMGYVSREARSKILRFAKIYERDGYVDIFMPVVPCITTYFCEYEWIDKHLKIKISSDAVTARRRVLKNFFYKRLPSKITPICRKSNFRFIILDIYASDRIYSDTFTI